MLCTASHEGYELPKEEVWPQQSGEHCLRVAYIWGGSEHFDILALALDTRQLSNHSIWGGSEHLIVLLCLEPA